MKNKDCIYSEICNLECPNTCLRYLEMRFLLNSSGIPKSKQKINKLIASPLDYKAYETLSNIRENILDFTKHGRQLYIYSDNCGNGKTTWSIKLMLQYFNEVWAGNGFIERGLFINVPVFITSLKNNISNKDENLSKVLELIPKVDLVIWDDIATDYLTPYEHGMLLSYIDQRNLSDKSNIFTGNVKPDRLVSKVGERLSSRIKSGILIELKGGDARNGSAPDFK